MSKRKPAPPPPPPPDPVRRGLGVALWVLVGVAAAGGLMGLIVTSVVAGWTWGLWAPSVVLAGAGLLLGASSIMFHHPRAPWWRAAIVPLGVWWVLLGVVTLSTAPFAPWYWLAVIGWALVVVLLMPGRTVFRSLSQARAGGKGGRAK